MKTTSSEVSALFTAMVAAASIFTVRPVLDEEQSAKLLECLKARSSSRTLYLRFEQAWACDCTLTVNFNRDWDVMKADKFVTHEVECQIGWAATGRNVADSLAAVELYGRVTKLAALFETAFAEIVLTDVPVAKEI